jgi:hypothetical protein
MLAEKLLQCVKGSIAVSNWMIGLSRSYAHLTIALQSEVFFNAEGFGRNF